MKSYLDRNIGILLLFISIFFLTSWIIQITAIHYNSNDFPLMLFLSTLTYFIPLAALLLLININKSLSNKWFFALPLIVTIVMQFITYFAATQLRVMNINAYDYVGHDIIFPFYSLTYLLFIYSLYNKIIKNISIALIIPIFNFVSGIMYTILRILGSHQTIIVEIHVLTSHLIGLYLLALGIKLIVKNKNESIFLYK